MFEQAQIILKQNALIRKNSTNAKSGSLLKGKLFDDKNNYMSPSHSNKKGKRYRYYVSQAQIQNRFQDLGSLSKIPATEIETFVTEKVKEFISDKKLLQEIFKNHPIEQQKIIYANTKLPTISIDAIRHIVLKVILSESNVKIIISKQTLKEAVEHLNFKVDLPLIQNYDAKSILEFNYTIRISGTTKNSAKLIIGDIQSNSINKTLVNALVKSFYYHKLLSENKLSSELKASSYVHRIMKLRFLPAQTIKAILPDLK